jgi:hypothetical protein
LTSAHIVLDETGNANTSEPGFSKLVSECDRGGNQGGGDR